MTDDTSHENILEQLFDYVQLGVEWGTEKFHSMCPPSKKRKPKKRCKPEKPEEDTDIGPPCTEKEPYILPSQICPKSPSCCYIKMQDPYAPCCCETKLPPCPPKCYRRPPREPICECDLCKKGVDSKCCELIAAFRTRANDFKYFKT